MRLFLGYLSLLIVLRGTFVTKENHHPPPNFPPPKCFNESPALTEDQGVGSVSSKLAARSTVKEIRQRHSSLSAPLRLLTVPFSFLCQSFDVLKMPLCLEASSVPVTKVTPHPICHCGT